MRANDLTLCTFCDDIKFDLISRSPLFVCVAQTSVAATSTIYQLSQNPDKQEKLYNELKQIMPDPRSPVDTKTLEQMPFLRACIKETLR